MPVQLGKDHHDPGTYTSICNVIVLVSFYGPLQVQQLGSSRCSGAVIEIVKRLFQKAVSWLGDGRLKYNAAVIQLAR